MAQEKNDPKIHCARCGKELAIGDVKHGPFPDHMMPMCADCAGDSAGGGW